VTDRQTDRQTDRRNCHGIYTRYSYAVARKKPKQLYRLADPRWRCTW